MYRDERVKSGRLFIPSENPTDIH
jgi:hypothetical protein